MAGLHSKAGCGVLWQVKKVNRRVVTTAPCAGEPRDATARPVGAGVGEIR